jgi:hypothetical protein
MNHDRQGDLTSSSDLAPGNHHPMIFVRFLRVQTAC